MCSLPMRDKLSVSFADPTGSSVFGAMLAVLAVLASVAGITPSASCETRIDGVPDNHDRAERNGPHALFEQHFSTSS